MLCYHTAYNTAPEKMSSTAMHVRVVVKLCLRGLGVQQWYYLTIPAWNNIHFWNVFKMLDAMLPRGRIYRFGVCLQ